MTDALEISDPTEDGRSYTIGHWVTETESASVFDRHVEALDLFRIYREVTGTLMQPRPSQRDRGMRIDRVLVPTDRLILEGWRHGAIGVELKRSGIAIGPPLAQLVDYSRSVWPLRGVLVHLGAAFLWPVEKQSGPLASLMVHNRIGTVSLSHGRIKFCLGEEVLLAKTFEPGFRVGRIDSGHAVGSR